jgi:predicted metal-binding membrane protein
MGVRQAQRDPVGLEAELRGLSPDLARGAVPRTRPRGPGAPPLVLWAIGGAWLLAVLATATGQGPQLHHDALLDGSLPFSAALLLFVIAWQAMIAAMMLPSSLPMVRLVAVTAGRQQRPRRVMAAFIGGYALIWTLFGYAAFCGDALVHSVVDATPWLADRPWLIAGSTLVVAGAFQFSSLKDRCLRKCRHPGSFLLAHYRGGEAGAFRLGRLHGLYCLGCCWALMLVMFAAGVAMLWWMAALTALMVFEKTAAGGQRAVSPAGIVLLVWGALVLLHPGWLPQPFGGQS